MLANQAWDYQLGHEALQSALAQMVCTVTQVFQALAFHSDKN